MDKSGFLFDTRPYYVSGHSRVVPLERPERSAIGPEVWDALLRVKATLDRAPKRRRDTRGR